MTATAYASCSARSRNACPDSGARYRGFLTTWVDALGVLLGSMEAFLTGDSASGATILVLQAA